MYKEIDKNKLLTWLIIFCFILLIISFFIVYGYIRDGSWFGLIIGILVSVPSALIGYYSADQVVLWMAGAKEAKLREDSVLVNLVDNLSIATGLPRPKIYIIDTPALNAFATGRDPAHSAIAVTSGLLAKLEKVELEGVLAHEMAHIKNYDSRLGVITAVFVGLISFMAQWFFRIGGFGRSRDRKDSNIIFVLLGVVFILLSPLVAQLMQMALSRNREYLADAEAGLITRFPDGLARALEKIAGTRTVSIDNKSINHLYIINPLEAVNSSNKLGWWDGLFSTHPPTEERIKRLREMLGNGNN